MNSETVDANDRIYFRHLDVVRFVAAFMVVMLHSYECWKSWFGNVGFLTGGTYKEFTPVGGYVNQFLENMGIGVDIFFLVSGFLITYILLQEKKKNNRIAIGKFMIRRSLRIWPLYFLLIALSPFLVAWVGSSPEPNYTANLLFVGNFEIIQSQTWVYPMSHFWSICVEEHFYLVWPFVIAFIPKRWLMTSFVVILLSSILFRIYAVTSMEFPWYTLFLHTLSRMDVLVIGAIGAYYYAEKPFTFTLSKTMRWSLIGLLVLSLSIEPVVLWNSVFLAGFKKYFYIAIFAVLLLDYNFNTQKRRVLKDNSFIHYLGKVSFGIYMFSNMILLVVVKKIMWHYGIFNMWFFFFITISLSLLIPIISYELFEKHFLKNWKTVQGVEDGRPITGTSAALSARFSNRG